MELTPPRPGSWAGSGEDLIRLNSSEFKNSTSAKHFMEIQLIHCIIKKRNIQISPLIFNPEHAFYKLICYKAMCAAAVFPKKTKTTVCLCFCFHTSSMVWIIGTTLVCGRSTRVRIPAPCKYCKAASAAAGLAA